MANEKRVEIFIPRGSDRDEPNLFIGVNGVSYLLPRGKKSKVPAHVAAEYERSVAAQAALDERKDEMTAAK